MQKNIYSAEFKPRLSIGAWDGSKCTADTQTAPQVRLMDDLG